MDTVEVPRKELESVETEKASIEKNKNLLPWVLVAVALTAVGLVGYLMYSVLFNKEEGDIRYSLIEGCQEEVHNNNLEISDIDSEGKNIKIQQCHDFLESSFKYEIIKVSRSIENGSVVYHIDTEKSEGGEAYGFSDYTIEIEDSVPADVTSYELQLDGKSSYYIRES